MDKLTLLCRSGKNHIEIYRCSCCGKLRIDYGPVSFTLKKHELIDFAAVIKRAIVAQEMELHETIALRLGEHSILRLTLDQLHDFHLCLITAQQTLEKKKRLLRPVQLYKDMVLN